jgi:hypothetical protein
MKTSVTVRFFKVEKNHNTAPDFEVALQTVFASGVKASQREKDVFGQILRLERLKKDNTFWAGEIVRKQIGDIPPEANDNGLQKLSVSEGGGIGHCIALHSGIAWLCKVSLCNLTTGWFQLIGYLHTLRNLTRPTTTELIQWCVKTHGPNTTQACQLNLW